MVENQVITEFQGIDNATPIIKALQKEFRTFRKSLGGMRKTTNELSMSTKGFTAQNLALMFGLKRVSDAIFGAASGSMNLLGISDTLAAIYEDVFTPALEPLADALDEAESQISNWDEGQKAAVGTGLLATGVIAGLGSEISSINLLLKALGMPTLDWNTVLNPANLGTTMNLVAIAFKTLDKKDIDIAMKAIGTAIQTGLTGIEFLLPIAIAAIALAWYSNWGGVKDKAMQGWDETTSAMNKKITDWKDSMPDGLLGDMMKLTLEGARFGINAINEEFKLILDPVRTLERWASIYRNALVKLGILKPEKEIIPAVQTEEEASRLLFGSAGTKATTSNYVTNSYEINVTGNFPTGATGSTMLADLLAQKVASVSKAISFP